MAIATRPRIAVTGFCRCNRAERARCTRLCPRGCRLAVSWESQRVCTAVLEAVTLPCDCGSLVNRASSSSRHYTHRHASIVNPCDDSIHDIQIELSNWNCSATSLKTIINSMRGGCWFSRYPYCLLIDLKSLCSASSSYGYRLKVNWHYTTMLITILWSAMIYVRVLWSLECVSLVHFPIIKYNASRFYCKGGPFTALHLAGYFVREHNDFNLPNEENIVVFGINGNWICHVCLEID